MSLVPSIAPGIWDSGKEKYSSIPITLQQNIKYNVYDTHSETEPPARQGDTELLARTASAFIPQLSYELFQLKILLEKYN